MSEEKHDNSNKPHVLIVDDDSRILKLLKLFLVKQGYIVETAVSANDAEVLMKKAQFDLMILDVMMPDVTGTDFAQKIKSSGAKMPIILLTALSEAEDRIQGLESGADDYVTKPFEPRELILRMNKLLELYDQPSIADNREILRFGSCAYDLTTKRFSRNDEVIRLSSTEQKLLEILIVNVNEVVDRESLATMMGGLSDRSVDVQIVRLRGKIEDDPKTPIYLQTVRNHGYVLRV